MPQIPNPLRNKHIDLGDWLASFYPQTRSIGNLHRSDTTWRTGLWIACVRACVRAKRVNVKSTFLLNDHREHFLWETIIRPPLSLDVGSLR